MGRAARLKDNPDSRRHNSHREQQRPDHWRPNGTDAQYKAQSCIDFMMKHGATVHDMMEVIIAPQSLLDVEQLRRCGKHSGIPDCCIEHYITSTLPGLAFAGKRLRTDDVDYIRCPDCRRADHRVTLRKCNCFYFTSPPEPPLTLKPVYENGKCVGLAAGRSDRTQEASAHAGR